MSANIHPQLRMRSLMVVLMSMLLLATACTGTPSETATEGPLETVVPSTAPVAAAPVAIARSAVTPTADTTELNEDASPATRPSAAMGDAHPFGIAVLQASGDATTTTTSTTTSTTTTTAAPTTTTAAPTTTTAAPTTTTTTTAAPTTTTTSAPAASGDQLLWFWAPW